MLTHVLTQRYSWVPFALVLLFYTGVQVRNYGSRFADWDLLLLSGWATLVLGLLAAQTVPSRLRQTIERLADRGVLVVAEGKLGRLNDELDEHSLGWATKTGCVVAVAILVSFTVAFPKDRFLHSSLLPFEMLGGFVAGFHLGRLASYGRLGQVLRRTDCSLQPTPGHIDQAAGLKPVGDFFFYQAMIAGLPAVFLAAWWFVIPLYNRRYAYWRQPYLALLALAIALEILAFLAPLLSFHKEMVESKRQFLREADKLSIEITELAATPAAKDQLAARTDRYLALEEMPTWPIDARTRRRFRLNNLALFLPLIGNALGNTELGKQISDVLRSMTQ